MTGGVTTSLSVTLLVMLAVGFTVLSMSQNMAQHLNQTFSSLPRTLVQ